ncbi:hypothetical protein UlMin_029838 [Ulmus minor]
MASLLPSVIFPLLCLLISNLETSVVQSVGVCNGRIGSNLPSEADVVALYKSRGITRMRIYDPNHATLEALRGSNIELIVDIFKGDLQSLNDAGKATEWVQNNIRAFPDVKFRYIAVGNEVHPNDAEAQFVLPAMQNIQNALSSVNLQGQIKVSTAIDTTLQEGYPPGNGVFSAAANSYITPIIRFLAENGSPLLANIYPYFAYVYDPAHQIPLPYALFTSPGVVVHDPVSNLDYQNLFDAMLDTLYSALEKVNAPNLKIVVSESGWPSEGGDGASVENAGTYYRNLISHVKGGSPKRKEGPIETYLFAMFDENKKDGNPVEQHFGLFSPNQQPKYQLNFS